MVNPEKREPNEAPEEKTSEQILREMEERGERPLTVEELEKLKKGELPLSEEDRKKMEEENNKGRVPGPDWRELSRKADEEKKYRTRLKPK